MKKLTRDELLEMLLEKQGDRPAYKLADELGISPAYLSDIMRGKSEPGPSILEALGLEKETVYVPASE